MCELENVIERAVVLGQSETLLAEDLPETVLDAPAPTSPREVTDIGDGCKEATYSAGLGRE
jgi:DNA-binding NtrC family response regulator